MGMMLFTWLLLILIFLQTADRFGLGWQSGVAAALCCWLVWRFYRRRALSSAIRERQLRDLSKSIELQHRQYTELSRQLEQTREFRHDLRHHMAALRGYAQSGDTHALLAYLDDMVVLKLDAPMRFCGNGAVDALAQQYLGRARAEGVEVDAVLEVGEDTGISAPDLCVVFGNCLENAVEAALRARPGNRSIRIRALETQGWLSIVQENGCPTGSLRKTELGYLSSKAEGRVGIGLVSVLTVAEKYGGTAQYQMEGERFRTSVILFKRDGEG